MVVLHLHVDEGDLTRMRQLDSRRGEQLGRHDLVVVKHLLDVAAIVHELEEHFSLSAGARPARQLADRVGDDARGPGGDPEVCGEEDFLLCAHDQVGHVSADVWDGRDDGQWEHAVAAH